MTSSVKKKIDKNLELQLMQIPIIKKLKLNKSSNLFLKLINKSIKQEYHEKTILRKHSHQPIKILLLINGCIEYQSKQNSKPEYVQGPDYIIFDRKIDLANVFKDGTAVVELSQKLMYEIFDGLIEFPQLKQKLKILENVSYFKNVSKRQLVKLATQIRQIVLGINSIVFSQNQTIKYCYVIAQGTILLKRKNNLISLLCKNDIIGYYDNNQQGEYRETAQVVTERVILFQINLDFFKEEKQFNEVNFYKKRLSWRKQKLQYQQLFQRNTISVNDTMSKVKKLSFIEKQSLLKSFYSKERQEGEKKRFYQNIKQKYSTKEQFYNARLNQLKYKRVLKYGPFQQLTILFKFEKKKKSIRSKTQSKYNSINMLD